MDKANMHEKQNKYVYNIERLNGGALDRLEWAKLWQLLDDMTEGIPVVLQPFSPTDKVIRGRILNSPERFEAIDTLSYPPADKCMAFGRCNSPKQPAFYAGVGVELILSEIGARPGDYVGLLYTSPLEELLCVRIGALNLWRRTSGSCLINDYIKNQIMEIYSDPANITAFLLDAFISDYFSREGEASTYKLTSAYSSVMLSANHNIAGIIYSSVDHTAGACLALKPEIFDQSMRPTEVQIVKVTTYLGYGIFDYERVAFADSFSEKKILWQTSK